MKKFQIISKCPQGYSLGVLVHCDIMAIDKYFIMFVKIQIFEKNTKAIVHGIIKKWGFEVGKEIEPFYVRMYVYVLSQ